VVVLPGEGGVATERGALQGEGWAGGFVGGNRRAGW
jgi:hypothetical protein